MKEYSLLERLMMVLRVIVSIISWVSRILFKIVRGMLPGGTTASVAPSPSRRADNSESSTP